MKRQSVHALFPFNRIDANHRRLAGKLDGCDDRIDLGSVEIAIELLPRLPFFDQQ